jgi:endoglucanase
MAMHEASHQFLKDLLLAPSPSGYERPVQDVVRAWAGRYADEVRTDRHGNVIAVRNPTGQPRIMLAGHCDQLGLIVQYIDDHGFLYVQPIGGWDIQILLGQNLTVWTKGGPVNGVVARRAPHLMSNEEKNKAPQFTDIWVDVGAKDRKEAQEVVAVGDPITATLSYRELRNDLAVAPGLDDKSGLWVVMETLRLVHDRKLAAAVFCVSTVQEEIGLRGATTSAHGIHPTVGIAVDVTHATDTPGNDKKQIGEAKLGEGPVLVRGPNINPHVFDRLTQAARDHEIPHQIKAFPRGTGTDANAIQLARDGVATGLVGLPNRYMHSPVEVVSLQDLDHAARLLAEFCAAATPQMDWTP